MDAVQVKETSILQLIIYNMLCTFDDMCCEAGIAYSLAGGTLLGALRHGGFIPWDDDIDVFMLRPDYERFIELFSEKMPEHLKLVHMNDGASGITWARILDQRTTVKHKTTASFNALWIDILPLDAVPDDPDMRKAYGKKFRKLRRVRLFLNSIPLTGRTPIRAILKAPVVKMVNILGAQKMWSKKISTRAQALPLEDVSEVAEIVAQGLVKGTTNWRTFRDSIKFTFVDRAFSVMPDWEHYLTGQYGPNYMQLPPKKKRKAHSLSVWVHVEQYDEDFQNQIQVLQHRSRYERLSERLRESYDFDGELDTFYHDIVMQAGYVAYSLVSSPETIQNSYLLYQTARHVTGVDLETLNKKMIRWIFAVMLLGYYEKNKCVLQPDLKTVAALTAEQFPEWIDNKIDAMFPERYFEQTLPLALSNINTHRPENCAFWAAQSLLDIQGILVRAHDADDWPAYYDRGINNAPIRLSFSKECMDAPSIEKTTKTDSPEDMNIIKKEIKDYPVPYQIWTELTRGLTDEEITQMLDKYVLPTSWYDSSDHTIVTDKFPLMADLIWKAFEILSK